MEPRFLEMVKLNFDMAAKRLVELDGMDPGMLEVIKGCNAVLRVSFPLRRDNGVIEVCACARAARGCARGDRRGAGARGEGGMDLARSQ
jgi:hypothetical protein